MIIVEIFTIGAIEGVAYEFKDKRHCKNGWGIAGNCIQSDQ